MSKLKPGDRIEVRWLDSYMESVSTYWTDPAVLASTNTERMRTIGYYVRSTKQFLTICQTLQTNGDFGAVFSIPLKTISKVAKI